MTDSQCRTTSIAWMRPCSGLAQVGLRSIRRTDLMSLTRRNLLLAGTLGAAFTAGLAPALAAPANASADAWIEEFMTRPGNRMGFDVNAMDEW